MATADKLTYLNTTKLLLRDAIRRAGHYLPDAATFRSYPYAMLPDEASLNLDFVRGECVAHNWRDGTASRAGLSNIMTTTRASGGGYFDHLGVYQWAANNTPRIDHDPATLSTSTTSATLAAGAVTLAVTVAYPVGRYVRATHDGSNWMAGRVTASTGSSVTLWVDRVVGSGTFASWTVIRVRGLLIEESRTNLIPYSDTSGGTWAGGGSVVRNVSTGLPSPFSVAATLERSASQSTFNYYQQLTPTAGTTYTFNVFVAYEDGRDVSSEFGAPGTENSSLNPFGFVVNGNAYTWASVSKTPAGRGGYRLSVTLTPSDNIVRGWGILIRTTHKSVASKLLVTGYMIETGAFPTSYIPTVASQVTRSADVASVNTLSPWYNASEGTIVASFAEGLGSYPPVFTLDDGTGNNRFYIYRNAASATQSTRLAADGSAGGASIFNSLSPTETGDGIAAFAYANNSFALVFKGGAVVTDNSGAVPTNTTLSIGNNTPTGRKLNGHIQSLEYYPRRLSNTELQEITA